VTPSARSTKLLRSEGFTVATVERWLPHANLRSDCFGFGDLLACRAGDKAILLVQTTTLPNLPARIAKAKALWVQAGGKVEFHGWVKRNERWQVKRVTIIIDELQAVVTQQPKRRRAKSRHVQGELLWDAPAPVDVRRE
jgi:hypothetical protein